MMDGYSSEWLDGYLSRVRGAFGERIVCVGLQGSRARGEAGPDSDIDLVLILDQAGAEDLLRYRAALEGIPLREKVCGFVSGRRELECWERADLISFYWDTQPLLGSLDFLPSLWSREDLRRGVLAGACGLYHACAHNLVHGQEAALLEQLRKSLFFTLRLKHLWKTGDFIQGKAALAEALPPAEQELLAGKPDGLEAFSCALLEWASRAMEEFGG